MRHLFSGILISVIALVASSAGALVTTMTTGSPTSGLLVGDQIVINFTVDNPNGEAVQQIFTTIMFDTSVVAVTNVLNLPSILGDPLNPFAPSIALVSAPEQKLLEADGTWIGLAYGGLNAASGPGGLAMQLTMTVVGAGSFDLTHLLQGTDLTIIDGIDLVPGDSAGLSFGSPISISAIPEPGTAVLMGLGLMGLAGAGRRKA